MDEYGFQVFIGSDGDVHQHLKEKVEEENGLAWSIFVKCLSKRFSVAQAYETTG